MKEMLLVAFLIVSVAACVPQSEVPDSTPSGNETEDVVYTEDFEGGEVEEGEELEVPPEGSLPLSGIIASLEIGDHTAITEVEFEDGVWEIEYVVGGEEYEIRVDPMTGEPLPDEEEE